MEGQWRNIRSSGENKGIKYKKMFKLNDNDGKIKWEMCWMKRL